MSMTIHNPYSYPITTGIGNVIWNNDKGHQTGSDKSLHLQNITVTGTTGSTTVWTGNTTNEYAMSWTTPTIISAGDTVTITFTFHQSYDNFDGTESIIINIATNGCVGIIIQS